MACAHRKGILAGELDTSSRSGNVIFWIRVLYNAVFGWSRQVQVCQQIAERYRRGRPFAVVGSPYSASAVRQLAQLDSARGSVLSIKRYVAGPLDRGRELASVPSCQRPRRSPTYRCPLRTHLFLFVHTPEPSLAICLCDQQVDLYRFRPRQSLASGRHSTNATNDHGRLPAP